MATNKELQDIIKEKNAKIKQLEEQIGKLTLERDEAQDQVGDNKPGGLSGYVITTKERGYNGVTFAMGRGIQFRRGRAVVLDSPEAPAIVNILRSDFGYQVIHSNNIHDIPEVEETLQKEFIEVLR